jgi:truncated hemoglobin YjbI/quinol monooxygenase YgiN
MITEYIRYSVPEDRSAAFEAAYLAAADSLTASAYCIDYELSRCVDEPGSYILQIHWTSEDDHPSKFRASKEFADFFAEIRPYVNQITEMRHYRLTGVRGIGRGVDPDVPSLYEWAGGQQALDALFTRFYDRVLADPLIGPLFAGMDPDHPAHVARWIAEVFGGPRHYTEQLGGYPAMLAHHRGLQLTEQQRRRWVGLLHDAADEVGLPDDPEFRAAFAGYIEWGTRIALANSQPDSDPPPDAPVPRWGWGVAPPWQPAAEPAG